MVVSMNPAPLITSQSLKDEVLDLMDGNLTADEERDRDQILAQDDSLLDSFLVRCALRRCIRLELELKRATQCASLGASS